MEKLADKKLGLFLDPFGRLSVFREMGIFQREAALYNLLADNFGEIYIFTYDNWDKTKELEFNKFFSKNIKIIYKPKLIPKMIYEPLIPFCHFGKILKLNFLKSNQNIGSLAPTIAKLIHPKAGLIIRSGYIGSQNAEKASLPFYVKIYYFVVENLAYLFCDKALISGENNYEKLIKKYPFVKNKITLLNNYVDTKQFKKVQPTGPNSLAQSNPKEFDIIYVARFQKDKNHLMLLEAVKDLNLRILFIGQGEYQERVVNKAKKYNINLIVKKVVSNQEIPIYYSKSRICVFPSLHEGSPKSLLEAMSAEVPVIGLRVSGVKDLINDQETGLLAEATTNDLRNKIKKLLKDEVLKERLGKKARDFVIQNYSLTKIYNQEKSIYEKI